jgi:hypothetical protein
MTDGRPAVELELAVPLGLGDYVYTCRLDAVTLLQDRYLLGQEHKSAAPSWVDRYVERMAKNAQFTGILFVMRTHPELRDMPWDCLQVNYHLKGWTPRSSFASPVVSGKTSRTPDALERFRSRAVGGLIQIQEAVAAFEKGLAEGQSFDNLMDWLFPDSGEHTGACYAFNAECEFMGPCRVGHQGTLGAYRPARSPGSSSPNDEKDSED